MGGENTCRAPPGEVPTRRLLKRLRDYIENTQRNVHAAVIYCPPAPVSLQEHHTGHKEEVLASRKPTLFLRGSAIQACKSSWDSL